MTQYIVLSKGFTSEDDRFRELFSHTKLRSERRDGSVVEGQVFLSEVKLYVAHVDEGVKDEFLRHVYSIASYAPSGEGHYDERGVLVKGTSSSKTYGGFKWLRARRWWDRLVWLFGRFVNFRPVKAPVQHSSLGGVLEVLGARIPGQVVVLGEVPDHKRDGSEDL